MTGVMTKNKQLASLANVLSVERDAVVQYVSYSTTHHAATRQVTSHNVREAALRAAYVATDRQLGAVRSQSAWPSPRSRDPAHPASDGTFAAALLDVRNRTLTPSSPGGGKGTGGGGRSLLEANTSLSSVFTFYVDVNEFLLLSVANTTQVVRRSSL